jgi:hypothetical protein
MFGMVFLKLINLCFFIDLYEKMYIHYWYTDWTLCLLFVMYVYIRVYICNVM